MKKLIFLFIFLNTSLSLAMASGWRIEAYLRRYRRKQTSFKETRTFHAANRQAAIAALKQYAREHTYKNYIILSEGRINS